MLEWNVDAVVTRARRARALHRFRAASAVHRAAGTEAGRAFWVRAVAQDVSRTTGVSRQRRLVAVFGTGHFTGG